MDRLPGSGSQPSRHPATGTRPTTRSAATLARSMGAGGDVLDPQAQRQVTLSTSAHSGLTTGPGANAPPAATSDERYQFPPTTHDNAGSTPTLRAGATTAANAANNTAKGPSRPGGTNRITELVQQLQQPDHTTFGNVLHAAASAASQAFGRLSGSPLLPPSITKTHSAPGPSTSSEPRAPRSYPAAALVTALREGPSEPKMPPRPERSVSFEQVTAPVTPLRPLPSLDALTKNRTPPLIKLEGPGFSLPIRETSAREQGADQAEQPSQARPGDDSGGTSSSHAALGAQNPPKNRPKTPPAEPKEDGELSPTAAANTVNDELHLGKLLPIVRKCVAPFMKELHSLGVRGMLEPLLALGYESIESILADDPLGEHPS